MKDNLINRISQKANNTKKEYTGHMTINRIFDEASEKYSGRTALIYGEEQITYAEFRNRVYSFGNYLIDRCGLKKGRVGIYMNRSIELLTVLYAVMETGCAYVPLDPIYPPQRLSMIVSDSETNIIITNIDDVPEELSEKCMVININSITSELERYALVKPPQVDISPADPLYIMFTSGSTGRPKGVVITHESVCNGFYWMNEYFDLRPGEKELLKTSINFDVSVWELFWPTLSGGTLVILEPEAHKEPKQIINAVCRYGVSTIHFVPSMLQSFLENEHCGECTSLKRVICIGEALEKYQVDMFFRHFKNCGIFNLYGPTEATVHVSYHECLPDEDCTTYSIGLPISNTQLYVLDENMNELDTGEMGELYIGGICLSPGYYNRPDLTTERFVDNPFSDKPGAKLYKTGDLASRAENGELNFYGRMDFQIKLHGFRIEIEEIEKYIKDHDFVEECVVSLVENKHTNDKKLAAYIVFHDTDTNGRLIDSWKTVYDETYRSVSNDKTISSGFGNVWRSSYSGMAFAQKEFDELMESTVSRIKALSPKNILEIGCGNGFVLHRLAESAESYVGTDISAVAIEKLKQSIDDKSYRNRTELIIAGADELDMLKGRKFDCIIINSVAQYFPSFSYFEKVITDSVELLEERGFIYLGDLRNLDLADIFYGSVRAYRNPELTVRDLCAAVKADLSQERELMISQNNIGYLMSLDDRITGVEVNKRIGKYENEMTKFRYDAVLFKDWKAPEICELERIDVSGLILDEKCLEEIIDGRKAVILTNVLDTMLIRDNYLAGCTAVRGQDESLRNILDEKINLKQDYTPLYEITAALKRLGYYSFVRNIGEMMTEITVSKENYCFNSGEVSGAVSNVPADNTGDAERFYIIRENLKKQLPEYMVPSYFIRKKHFDYLPNGKLDRSSLSGHIDIHREVTSEFAEAKTELQKNLTKLWKDILGIDKVGVRDSFIELGGHSLLAVKMLSAVRRRYGADISLMDFFLEATVEHLARLIENCADTDDTQSETLPNVKKYEPFSLMPLQQSYYIGRQSDVVLGKVPTHIYCEIEFDSYDHNKFISAVNTLIRKEDALRSRVSQDGTQRVIPFTDIIIPDTDDYTALSGETLEKALSDKRQKLSYTIIDVTKDMPVYFSVSLLNGSGAVVYIYADCMYFDGWSFEKLLNKLDILYRGGDIAAGNESVTYQQYAEYFRISRSGKKYEADRAYWLNKISSLAENPHVRLLSAPSDIKDIRYLHMERRITEKMYADITALAANYGVSIFAVLLTAYGRALSKICRNKRFLLNIPIAKRPEFMKNINELIGECSDFLLYDYEINTGASFMESALSNQKKLWEMNDHSSFTGTDTVREIYRISGDRDNLSAPFVFTSLLDIPAEKHSSFRKKYYETHTSQVWMDIVAVRFNDEIQFNFESVRGLISEEVIEAIADSFIGCLRNLADKNLNAVDISEEKVCAVPTYDNTSEIPKVSLIGMLTEAAERFADRIAVREYDREYTYKEIFGNALVLAEVIKKSSVITNRPAAVVLPRGRKVIECALAILYAGGIYMPLDYEYPVKTICGCAENANAAVIITDRSMAEQLKNNTDICIVSTDDELSADGSIEKSLSVSSAESCICIIHTSGSTGKPKAIRLSQAAVINCIIASHKVFGTDIDDCIIAVTNPCHDMSLYDIFGVLPYGGSIAVLEQNDIRDTSAWIRCLTDNRVTIWNSVPIFMEMLLETEEISLRKALSSLRTIIQGGDYFRPQTALKLRKLCPECRLFNVGGPSETTIWNIYHEVTDEDISAELIPYGKPIDNTKYYILGDDRRPLAKGVMGTMYVSGICVSDGYIGLDELTKERFVPDIFAGGRNLMYNTGDLGYINEIGSIIFCGRADRQVKINGKRIELEGIENAALQINGIRRAAAVVKSGNIILYCESDSANEKSIREIICDLLPSYMQPAAICILKKFPINSNGKICIAELPEVDIVLKQRKSSANDGINCFLREICRDILGKDDIDTSDNFFVLGGNSIKLIRLLALIREKYGVLLSIKDIFMNPYISDWHDMIEERCSENQNLTEEPDYNNLSEYPVSISQQGIWISEMLSPVSSYTMNVYTRITGTIDENLLKKAAFTVLSGHPALNVVFDMNEEGMPIQKYCEPHSDDFIFNVVISSSEQDMESQLYALNHIIMDIQEGPFYQCTLIKSPGSTCIFNLTCHHIVCDEQSFIIIMNGIFRCYDSLKDGITPIVTEKLPYAKYCVLSRKDERTVEQWRDKLTEDVLVPVKFDSLDEDRQNRISFEIPDELCSCVRDFCSVEHTSEYMVLMALMSKAVSELSGRERFVVLSPYSDRINMGYEDTVGFFTKNTAIVFDCFDCVNFRELIERNTENVLNAFENAVYPYEEIINRLGLSHDHADRRKRIVFNMIDSERRNITGAGYKAAPFEYLKTDFENPTGLNIFAENINDRIILNLMIHEDYISVSSAKKLRDIFINNIEKLFGE